MVLLPIRILKAVYKEGSSASGRAGMGRDVGGTRDHVSKSLLSAGTHFHGVLDMLTIKEWLKTVLLVLVLFVFSNYAITGYSVS